MDRVDRRSSVPLVHQLSGILRRRILEGVYKPNEPIPTEEQLMEEHRVSRTTVRLALARLVNEGLIRREQGRGTFVNPVLQAPGWVHPMAFRPVSRDLVEVKSTTHIIESAGMTPSTQLIALEIQRPPEHIAQQLCLSATEPVFRIERLRLADEIPLVLERVWLPEALCPGLTERDLEGSLYRTLAERYGLELAAAHQTLKAVVVSGRDAARLQLPEGSPAMLVTGVTYLADGRPIEAEYSLFNGNMMEFIVDLGVYSRFARIARDRRAEDGEDEPRNADGSQLVSTCRRLSGTLPEVGKE
ncbi:MAG: GntR family transcriptional regulator [Firmicutes bacterium]|nr:GntR family transcriptional regulator [Bacillota bacterium]